MRRLFGCPDIVSLTEKFLMARNFYRFFTENNPVMGDSKTFGIPEAKGLIIHVCGNLRQKKTDFLNKGLWIGPFALMNCLVTDNPRRGKMKDNA